MEIFDGEYLNGKRWNGKGKEYYKGDNIIIEGEYKNGILIGKEYYIKELVYEGNFQNGKRFGKGKQYWNNKLKFEGEFLNGKRFGNGKEYNYDGNLIFEGEYKYGKRNGKGKEYDNNGKIKFEGKYLNGKKLYNLNK